MRQGALVVGFGPFLNITDNPAASLARAMDGKSLPNGQPIWGRVMDVSYARAPRQTLDWCAALAPAMLVGVGVARSRTVITVETAGSRLADGCTPDVDGAVLQELAVSGPDTVQLPAPAALLAEQLGGVVGTDAGRYVCNAWIYRICLALRGTAPVTFLHIPPSGLSPTTLVRALACWDAGGHHELS
jgi:pyrrolidone-carboxylate peptidase